MMQEVATNGSSATDQASASQGHGTQYQYYTESLQQRYGLDVLSTRISKDNLPSAEVSWDPVFDRYAQRAASRLKYVDLQTPLPHGWPRKIKSPLAWTGSQIDANGGEETYVYNLSREEISEILDAVTYFKTSGFEISEMSKENFPLPTLASKLKSQSEELHDGKGFVILRGLDPQSLSGEDNALLFVGLSSHVGGETGKQDQERNQLAHIIDASKLGPAPDCRHPIHTNVAQPFHSDVMCHILALYTMNCAAQGGTSVIASSAQVYNELAATRPDLVRCLANDWTFDTLGAIPPYHERPLLFYEDGRLIMSFARTVITGSKDNPRTPGLPPLTEEQAEALDAVHFIAEKHSLKSHMQPGDLRFINNLAVLHRRDSFIDDAKTPRHLMRLWLKHEELSWKLPPILQLAMDRVFNDGSDEKQWMLEPDVKMVTRRRANSCGNA